MVPQSWHQASNNNAWEGQRRTIAPSRRGDPRHTHPLHTKAWHICDIVDNTAGFTSSRSLEPPSAHSEAVWAPVRAHMFCGLQGVGSDLPGRDDRTRAHTLDSMCAHLPPTASETGDPVLHPVPGEV